MKNKPLKKIEISSYEVAKHQDFDRTFALVEHMLDYEFCTAAETGIPRIVDLHFFKTNGTDGFTISLPVLPLGYTLDKNVDLDYFINFGSPDTNANKITMAGLSPEMVLTKSLEQSLLAFNYVCHELAYQYIDATKEGDFEKAMLIQNLDIMKDFDLSKFTEKNKLTTKMDKMSIIRDTQESYLVGLQRSRSSIFNEEQFKKHFDDFDYLRFATNKIKTLDAIISYSNQPHPQQFGG